MSVHSRVHPYYSVCSLINGFIVSGEVMMKEVKVPPMQGHITQPPNLHLLGKLFLSCGVQQMFDVLIILQL